MRPTKRPRDFVHVDELWEADEAWRSHFIEGLVWVFSDEYRAELSGDESYSRIIIHAGDNEGWLYIRPLAEKMEVANILSALVRPVSEKQLSQIGFTRWEQGDI